MASGYEIYNYNGHSYTVTNDWSNWAAAEQEAVNLGGHLVTINDEEEDTWLTNTFKDTYDRCYPGDPNQNIAWIGYYYDAVSESWKWISGEPVTYYSYAPFWPLGGTHAYLHLANHGSHGTWGDNPVHDEVYCINAKGIIEFPGAPSVNHEPVANAGHDQSVNKGDTVTFSGSFTDSDPGDTHTISWNFGDGSASVTGTLTPTHVYANSGDYTVTLTVTDSNGGVGTDTMGVTVKGLIVEYHFNGDFSDSSGNGNNGINHGAAFVDGISGQALSLDGTDYVTSTMAGFPSGSNPRTLSAWVKSNNYGAQIAIDYGIISYLQEFGLGYEIGGDGRGIWIDYGYGGCTSGYFGTPGQWAHITTTFDGSIIKIYYNGNLISTCSATLDTRDSNIRIGGRINNMWWFNGVVDEVKIYNKELNFDEIKTEYEKPFPVAEANGPYVENEGSLITFDASGSQDPDDDVLQYRWDFDNDGTWDTEWSSSPYATKIWGDDFSGTVKVEVSDGKLTSADTATVAVNNVPPTATLNPPTIVNEGSAITLSLTNPSDPSSTDITAGFLYAFDCGTGFSEFGSGSTASCPTTDNDARTVKARIKDKDGGENEYTAPVTINNAAPTAIFAATGPIDEGSSSTLSLSTPSDPGMADTSAGFHYSFACDGLDSSLASTYALAGTASTATCAFNDNSDHTVKSRIFDKDDGYTTYEATVSVNNVEPIITSTAGPSGPLALGGSAGVNAGFTDAGSLDTHTCTISWDDGTPLSGMVTESGGSGSCTGSPTYLATGVYTVGITVSDDDAGSAVSKFEYVVVYDPNGGFVTGGGWINSPAGAYAADPAMTGRANFGFVSKYQKGANIPTGQTQFQFRAGDLNFHSTVYEWLVVAGSKAQYKGSGTINGAGDYGFLLTATDGQVSGGGGVDKFRIKIVDKAAGTVVYDNVLGVSDDMDAANPQAIGGGSIVIHK